MAGKTAPRISPLILLFKPDTLYIGIVFRIVLQFHKRADLVIGKFFCQYLVFGIRIGVDKRTDFRSIHPEAAPQSLQCGLHIFFLFRHETGIQYHIVHFLADSQLRSLAVHNVSPFKRYDTAVITLLGQYLSFILLSVITVNQDQPDA